VASCNPKIGGPEGLACLGTSIPATFVLTITKPTSAPAPALSQYRCPQQPPQDTTEDKHLQRVWLSRGWNEASHLDESDRTTSAGVWLLGGQKEHTTKGRLIANKPDKMIVLAPCPPLMLKAKVTCAGTEAVLSQGWGGQSVCFSCEAPLAVESSSWAVQYTEWQPAELTVLSIKKHKDGMYLHSTTEGLARSDATLT